MFDIFDTYKNLAKDTWKGITGGGWNYDNTLNSFQKVYDTWTGKTPSTLKVTDVVFPKTPASPGANDPNNQAVSALQKQVDALLKQLNSQPRNVSYDLAGSWNKAREMATQAVNPIYQQKMTDFVNRQTQELGRKQSDITSGKSALDTALNQLYQDTGVARRRTLEDTNTNIDDIRATQAFQDRQESLNFDAANRALTEGLGAGNMAESGLGQQQVQEAQQQRREMSNEAVRQMDNKVEAANTLMNRSFEDLDTKETRGAESTTEQKQKLDIDLERFIEDQAYTKDQQTKQWELDKAADIANKSVGTQRQLVDEWIASLAGKGYTAQEIANAASIYR